MLLLERFYSDWLVWWRVRKGTFSLLCPLCAQACWLMGFLFLHHICSGIFRRKVLRWRAVALHWMQNLSLGPLYHWKRKPIRKTCKVKSTIGAVEWELEKHLGWTEVKCCDWRAALVTVSVKYKIPAGGDIKGNAVIKTCELYFT